MKSNVKDSSAVNSTPTTSSAATSSNNNNNKKAKKATAEPKVEAAVVVSAPPAPQAEKTSSSAKKKNKKNKHKAAVAAAAALAASTGEVVAEGVVVQPQVVPVNAKKEKSLGQGKESSALPDKVVLLAATITLVSINCDYVAFAAFLYSRCLYFSITTEQIEMWLVLIFRFCYTFTFPANPPFRYNNMICFPNFAQHALLSIVLRSICFPCVNYDFLSLVCIPTL